MLRIAICGAHGTGKTTQLQELTKLIETPVLQRTMRTFWEDHGVSDFEKLLPEVRTVFQKYALMNQIQREDSQWEQGFITDRSVIDNLGYTKVSSSMSGADLELYVHLVKERAFKYDVLIYLPVEFPAEPEYLRAHPELQNQTAAAMEYYLYQWFSEDEFCLAKGSVEERVSQVTAYIDQKIKPRFAKK